MVTKTKTSSSPPFFQMPDAHALVKAATAGGAFAAGEYYVLKNYNMEQVGYNGATVAAGILLADSVSEGLVSILNLPFTAFKITPSGIVKGIEYRVLEIAGGAAAATLLNHYMLKTPMTQRDMGIKLGMIVGADLLGEAVADTMTGRDLNLFD